MRVRFIARPRYGCDDESAPIQLIAETLTPDSLCSTFGEAVVKAREAISGVSELRWNVIDTPFGEEIPQPEEFMTCLDIDNIDAAIPPAAIVSQLTVQPWAWWCSKSSNGLHLMYVKNANFTAAEMARVASLYVSRIDSTCRCEILARSATPTKRVTQANQTPAPEVVRKLRNLLITEDDVVDDEKSINDYLEDRGWEIGRRIGHDQCPFDPVQTTRDDSVELLQTGVKCYRCDKYITYDRLFGKTTTPRILTAAYNRVHWRHARYILEADHRNLLGDKKNLFAGADLYRALLKCVLEPDDPRIPKVFNPSLRLVRGAGFWMDDDAEFRPMPSVKEGYWNDAPYGMHAIPKLKLIPGKDDQAPQEVVEWETPHNSARTCELYMSGSLPGYVPIQPIIGHPIFGFNHEYTDKEFLHPSQQSKKNNPPKYLDAEDRLDWNQCHKVLDKSFPGIDMNYLKLLIVAAG